MSLNVLILKTACEFYLSGRKDMGDSVYKQYLNCQPPKPMTCTYANTMLTYDEWRNRGYQVQSGEKATWVNNLPLFKRSQVKSQDNTCRIPNPSRPPSISYDSTLHRILITWPN